MLDLIVKIAFDSPDPWKGDCVKQYALSGASEGRENKKRVLGLLTQGIYFVVHVLDYKRSD